MSGQNPSIIGFPSPAQAPKGNGGGGGNGKEVLQRLTALEERTRHLATKEDLAELKSLISEKEAKQTKWLIGIISAALGTALLAIISIIIGVIRMFLVFPTN